MKKLLLFIILAISFVSCKKEEVEETLSNKTTSTARQTSVNMRTYFDDGGPKEGTNYGCKAPSGNCWPDTGPTGLSIPIMNGIFETVLGGNQSSIRSSFTSNQSFLIEYMAEADIAKVISGESFVYGRGSNSTKRYFLLKSASDNRLQTVYPFY